eukprot:353615-Chlamydomonas_euryale.AAC.17
MDDCRPTQGRVSADHNGMARATDRSSTEQTTVQSIQDFHCKTDLQANSPRHVKKDSVKGHRAWQDVRLLR